MFVTFILMDFSQIDDNHERLVLWINRHSGIKILHEYR